MTITITKFSPDNSPVLRHNWSEAEILSLFALPFNDLIFQAQTAHRQYFDPNQVQISTLLSIKTGACPEDCKYCPQSAHHNAELTPERLMKVDAVLAKAKMAKQQGATRFCMGAAWKNPRVKDMPYVLEMVREVKAIGLETCMTLGQLDEAQAGQLASAGLDYYNHNLDTSPEFYPQIITTRTYQQRLDTLDHVRSAGMKVCAGGIIGMGETLSDRAGLLLQLANMSVHPESVPINMLVRVAGTPLQQMDDLEPFDFIRTIAVARILMPASHVRLSAGRQDMNEQMQALCFLAGANSIFYGERLLTTDNPTTTHDQALFHKLGIVSEQCDDVSDESHTETIDQALYNQPMVTLYYDASTTQ